MRNSSVVALLAAVTFAAAACKKGPGEGGEASIRGYVHVEQYNAFFTVLTGEYAGADEEVFIIYGDDVSYGDRLFASYDGRFEFKYLRKGKYKIYVYSEDTTLSDTVGVIPVVREVEITEKKQVVDAGTFVVKHN
jgi:hypothetical protein